MLGLNYKKNKFILKNLIANKKVYKLKNLGSKS